MAEIRINPEEVRGTGDNFRKMSAEVNDLVSRAKSVMGSLEGQFTGTRANHIFGQWRDMQPSLDAARQSLESAGQLLTKAAEDFAAVDMR